MLKPGGWLGLVWNVVAEPVEPWELSIASDSEEYDRLSKVTPAGVSRRLSYFDEEELEFRRVEWEWTLTPEERASFFATTSMAIAMPPEDRANAYERSRMALQQVCDEHGMNAMPVRHDRELHSLGAEVVRRIAVCAAITPWQRPPRVPPPRGSPPRLRTRFALCDSPAAQITAWPGPTSTDSPSSPATTARPATTTKTWSGSAG